MIQQKTLHIILKKDLEMFMKQLMKRNIIQVKLIVKKFSFYNLKIKMKWNNLFIGVLSMPQGLNLIVNFLTKMVEVVSDLMRKI